VGFVLVVSATTMPPFVRLKMLVNDFSAISANPFVMLYITSHGYFS
jgi:hypothetical protein